MATATLPDWATDFVNKHPTLLTRVEASKAIRIGQRTLDRHLANKSIPSIRVGWKVLIPARELANFLIARGA